MAAKTATQEEEKKMCEYKLWLVKLKNVEYTETWPRLADAVYETKRHAEDRIAIASALLDRPETDYVIHRIKITVEVVR